ELYKLRDRLIDQAIAERTKSPSLLRKLSYSKYPEVRYEVGGNDATPNSVRWEMLGDKEWTVLYALAGVTRSNDMLEILLKNPEIRVAGRAARSEHLSDTRLCIMVGDEDETYSERI
ncbi:MAG: hypothetical protein KGH71_06280, partial [Candidatus Micrarchaeota archaeon]|nr:hypothetical protein [Candidatus Micrarchaeota archaeon]